MVVSSAACVSIPTREPIRDRMRAGRIWSLQLTETDRSGFFGAIRPRRITPVLRRALRAARRASSSESEIRNLYEFTRRTLQMNLNEKPGPQIAGAVLDLFGLDAVAVFDADLQEV